MELRDLFNYGVPTGILVMLLWGIWKLSVWLRDNIAQPVVKAHLSLIATLQEHLPRQTDAIDAQTKMMKGQMETTERHTASVLKKLMDIPECRAEIIAQTMQEVSRDAATRIVIEAEHAAAKLKDAPIPVVIIEKKEPTTGA